MHHGSGFTHDDSALGSHGQCCPPCAHPEITKNPKLRMRCSHWWIVPGQYSASHLLFISTTKIGRPVPDLTLVQRQSAAFTTNPVQSELYEVYSKWEVQAVPSPESRFALRIRVLIGARGLEGYASFPHGLGRSPTRPARPAPTRPSHAPLATTPD